VDYVAGLGGGTVRLLLGTFRFGNAVQMRSGVRVVGSGLDKDASEFRVGDGIVLRGPYTSPSTLHSLNGNYLRTSTTAPFSAPAIASKNSRTFA
jgi:hypothetical protein